MNIYFLGTFSGHQSIIWAKQVQGVSIGTWKFIMTWSTKSGKISYNKPLQIWLKPQAIILWQSPIKWVLGCIDIFSKILLFQWGWVEFYITCQFYSCLSHFWESQWVMTFSFNPYPLSYPILATNEIFVFSNLFTILASPTLNFS